ncbi:hypothetical protein HZH66_003704 [Vespula vulgaris]|uniref:Glucose-methanol-choline oxidoreductase N-terminal domain-containing protein n=1 Tax=Vespula vulgaris TaxID=7454 RepID=A0A834KDP0_VESVU|nr:hypothetical protein HZH66_003704 [Vespula vulgaris]
MIDMQECEVVLEFEQLGIKGLCDRLTLIDFNNSCNILGGSSVLNTMLYIRGSHRDFDQWESFGNPGWEYDDVLPYFKKSQDQRNPFLAQNTTYHSTDITSGIETSIQFYEKMLFIRGYLTVQDSPFNTPLSPTYLQAAQEMGYNIVDINGEQQI